MCSIPKKIGALFCAVGIILMFIAGVTFNNNVYADDSSEGVITLTCEQDGTILPGMLWQIYLVGERVNGNVFSLSGDFAGYPVDLSKITDDTNSMTEAATTLSNFAILDDIYPDDIGVTDGDGIVSFSGLKAGMYLVVGSKLKIGNYTYFPTAFLVETDGKSENAIDAFPKFFTKSTLPGARDRYILRKIWINSNFVDNLPPELIVEIYQDNTLYDTISLTEKNNWSYSWEGDASSDWRVKEVSVPGGCYVMYRNNETQYVIMNSFDEELLALTTTTTTVTTTKGTMPGSETTTTVSTSIPEGNDTGSAETTSKTTDDSADFTRTAQRTTETTTKLTGDLHDNDTETTVAKNTATKPGDSTTKPVDSTTKSTTKSENTTTSYYTDSNGSTIYVDTTTTTVETDKDGNTVTTTTKTDKNGNIITTTTKAHNTVRTTINNSRNTTTTTTDKLPQTGQLWWPVPVMFFGGMIFVAVGLRLISNSRKED